MISILKEPLLTLAGAKAFLADNGVSVSTATVYRWVSEGLSGIFLETVTVGAKMHTSAAAIQRFIADTTKHSEHKN